MSEQQLNEIADKADMIIANYSFTVTDNGDVKIVFHVRRTVSPRPGLLPEKQRFDRERLMPKYFPFKIAGYYLYFTMACIVECIHAHASDSKLTEAGSAKLFIKSNGDTVVQKRGSLSDKDLLTIQKYIKNNYLTMFEMWSQHSEHGFFGENK